MLHNTQSELDSDPLIQRDIKDIKAWEEKAADTWDEEIPIEIEYPNKIVYTTQTNVDPKALKEDCQERQGSFNECGSICRPEAEACLSKCAYTCNLKEIYKDMDKNWEEYHNKKAGLKILRDLGSKIQKSIESQP